MRKSISNIRKFISYKKSSAANNQVSSTSSSSSDFEETSDSNQFVPQYTPAEMSAILRYLPSEEDEDN